MSPHGVSPRSPVDPNTCCTCAVTQQPDSFFESNISHNKNDKPFSDFRPKSHHCDDLLLNKAIVLECFFGLRVWETTSQNVAYLQAKLIFFGFLNLQWLNRNSQLYTGRITGIDQGANNLPDRNCTYDTYDGFPKAKWVQKCRKSQLEKPSLVIIHSFLKFCTCCLHKQKSWKNMKEPNPHPVNHPASQACFFSS